MTVRPKSLTEQYQVYVDFTDGGSGVLINSYRSESLAEKCVSVLNSNKPGSYVARAWYVDTRA